MKGHRSVMEIKKLEVNTRYKQAYHANVSSGWSNDPNGMIYFNGKAHLFFQHYPHQPSWGTMHWGHYVTDDFIKWEELPVALVPDENYEQICGCCSGNAIAIDNKLYLMYTAAQPDRQRQCYAISSDGGVTFKKVANNPILRSEQLSDEVAKSDFRDPKPFRKDGWFYCLAGTRIIDPNKPDEGSGSYSTYLRYMSGGNPSMEFDPDGPISGSVSEFTVEPANGYGNMILFRSRDLYHWEYLGKLIDRTPGFNENYFKLDGVYECPDYINFGDTDVILASPQNLPQDGNMYENIHSSLALIGKLNFETGHFDIRDIQELDAGFDFYAPQNLPMPDGRNIMIAWKEMWDRSYPTQEDNWAGTYTLPRELSFKDGRVYQAPVREVEKYHANKVEISDLVIADGSATVPGIEGNIIDLTAEFKLNSANAVGIRFFKGAEHETVIRYDRNAGTVVMDRTNAGIPLTGKEENINIRTCDVEKTDTIKFRVFLDVISAEVFINDGRYTITGNMYPNPEDIGVEFFAEGGEATVSAVKYDMDVK